ncbi:hypothetical protein CEXT_420061 [Caerostris extrusa]|uniref:Uncharacterized protein n=1 Tax=Caerostris extrusa TaxID=172846 RepID=A0AAV4XH52_CAEEX|nr:hypothetical protein CEXT_420061 [Caerostris extrusa]
MTEYRLLRIRSLMNNEHLTHTNVNEGGGGGFSTKTSSAPDHRLGTNDQKRPSRPQRGSLIEQSKVPHQIFNCDFKTNTVRTNLRLLSIDQLI